MASLLDEITGASDTAYLPNYSARKNDRAASRETQETVQGLLDDTTTLAVQSQDRALAVIEELGNFSVDLPFIETPSIPIPTLTLPTLGDAPAEPTGLTPSFSTAPTEPTLTAISTITMPDAPEFLEDAPTLLDVELPDPFGAALPTEPELTDVAIPVTDDLVLPAVPTLLALNLPDAPTVDLPVFNESIGAMPVAPDTEFAWSEVEYQTSLLSMMNSRLLTFVTGASTGLTAEVENAIWNRARDRQAIATQALIEDASKLVASRGFKAPNGVLTRLVQQALQERMNKDVEISRDIMIKQAELEQENFKFSFTTAVQLESRLIEHFNQVQNRAFEAAKYTFQAVILIFDAKVKLFQADVTAFGVKVEIFKARLQAELARLEVYKSELEGQRLVSTINESQVKVYATQIEAAKANVDVFKARVDAARVQIEAQASKVEVFRAKLQGYESQVRAKAAEYEGYATQVKAEATKVDMFATKAQAFRSRTEAYSALVDAKLGEQNINFKQLQEFPLEVYKQRISAYQVNVQAEADRLKSLAEVYDTKVKAFAALEQAKAVNVQSQTDVLKATTDVAVEQAKLIVQAAQANLQLAVTAHETAQSSLRSAGQLSGQLAAAALAARNISASISSSDNFGDSTSYADSYSAQNSASNSTSQSASFVAIHTTSGD